MITCIMCKSDDIIKATHEATGLKVAICRECGLVYELDKKEHIVLKRDPLKREYYLKLQKMRANRETFINIVPYNQNNENKEGVL